LATGFRFLKSFGIDRLAVRQAQVAEDFDDHRRVFDGSDDLQSAAAVGAVFDVDVEDSFE
jgi:hypothetical protein